MTIVATLNGFMLIVALFFGTKEIPHKSKQRRADARRCLFWCKVK
jgi:hypothetical protein